LAVLTWQKPQARVQRSPLIMNVAVPSAQHSNMFGQPASSHTVTRPSPRTVWRSERNSVPMWALARSQGGLRASMGRAAAGSTPASASLASRPTSRTGRAGAISAPGAPAPNTPATPVLAEGSASAALLADGGTGTAASWRSTGRPVPQRVVATANTASTTSAIPTWAPSASREVTSLSSMPHGTIWPNMARSGCTLRAKPCMVRCRL
jgi:hypothetical protein